MKIRVLLLAGVLVLSGCGSNTEEPPPPQSKELEILDSAIRQSLGLREFCQIYNNRGAKETYQITFGSTSDFTPPTIQEFTWYGDEHC